MSAPDTSTLLRRLAFLKAQPKLAETLPQGEILALVQEVLTAVHGLKNAIETNKIKGEKGDPGKPGRTPLAGRDYLSLAQSEAILNDLEASYNRLSLDLEARLSEIKSGEPGKDAEITQEMLAEAAELASLLIELPDFEALFATVVQTNPAIVRDALELLPEGEKLAQEAIEDLPATLDAIRDSITRSRGLGGGIGSNQVNNIFDQRIPVSATAPINPPLNQLWVDIS